MKVFKCSLIKYYKNAGSYEQQNGDHGRRNPIRNVTTHLPNGLAPEMDGAHAGNYIQPSLQLCCFDEGGHGDCDEAIGASLCETAPSADLGGISNFSYENVEGRRGGVQCEQQSDMGDSNLKSRDAPLTQACLVSRKAMGFPNHDVDTVWRRKRIRRRRGEPWEALSFLFNRLLP